MNLLKHYTLLLGLFLLGVSASQAQITVTGTVVDGDQFGLPGVTVTVKGTNKAVATDFDGNYTIQVPSQESVLTFSFVGMSPQEITVGSQTKIDVTMEENAQELDEVVVVGYGTVKKRDLTGAVSQLKPSDQDAAKVTSIDNLLQGKIAGLSVGASASAPGAACPRCRIVGYHPRCQLASRRQPAVVCNRQHPASLGRRICQYRK